MERRAQSTSTRNRALSLVLVAVQLVVFTLGAAFAGSGAHATRAAGHRAVVTASSGSGGDGSVVASSSDARLEQATRARGHRGHAGGAPLAELALVPNVTAIAPAALTGSLEWAAAEREHRLLPSVVNGARGPPSGLSFHAFR